MKSLWFVVPAYGRVELAAICLRQLRRTCDALDERGIWATAVIVADDENLETARGLGFATVTRDNEYLSAKFNDGIQAATDPDLRNPPTSLAQYKVIRERGYRGHEMGTVFAARLDPGAENRAVYRGDIAILPSEPVVFQAATFCPPVGWDGRPADYVVPCGSDDWLDHGILEQLPDANTVLGFQHLAFVREDGREITTSRVGYKGGCGMRVYPRPLLRLMEFRPADEDRKRACDTSILINITQAYDRTYHCELPVIHRDRHEYQIVDWKTSDEQINPYAGVTSVWRGQRAEDPFNVLAGIYPAEALEEMAAFYGVRELAAA